MKIHLFALSVLTLLCLSQVHADDVCSEERYKALEERIKVLEEFMKSADPKAAKAKEDPRTAPVKTSVGNLTLNSVFQTWAVYDPTTIYGANEDSEATMRIRRAEFKFSGDIIPELGFVTMIDPAKSIKLNTKKDAEGNISEVSVDQSTNILQDIYSQIRISKFFPEIQEYAPNMELWVGQQKPPITEEGYRRVSSIDLIERSMLARAFGEFRDQGIMLKDSYAYLDYYVGVFNGSGRNKSDDNDEKNGVMRLVFKPLAEWKLGVSSQKGSYGQDEETRDRIGADTQIDLGSFSFKTEYMYGKDGDNEGNGFYFQPSYYVIPDKLQLVSRYDYFDPSETNNGTVQEIAGGINWFFLNNNAKLQLEYIRHSDDMLDDDNIVLTSLQLAY